jgi:hypothetical protein
MAIARGERIVPPKEVVTLIVKRSCIGISSSEILPCLDEFDIMLSLTILEI